MLFVKEKMFRDRFSEVSLYSMSGFDEVTTTSKFELPLPPPLANLYNDLTSVICKRNLSDAYMLLLINICRKDSLTMGDSDLQFLLFVYLTRMCERGGTPTTNMHEPTSLASTSAEVGNNNAKETSSVKVAALGELPYVDVSKTDNPKLKINEPRKPGQPY
ncbi:unnamed protein product [Brassica oleracea var. botrytis]